MGEGFEMANDLMDLVDLTAMGKRLRFIREQKKITQCEMAAIVECSEGHLCDLEGGNAKPSLALVVRFCKYNDCSLDFIVFGTKTERVGDEIAEVFEPLRMDLQEGSRKRIISLLRKILPDLIQQDMENFPRKNKKDGIFKN